MTQTLRAMMCNHAVTAPLWETQRPGSWQGQASTSLSASACKILTFLLEEDTYKRLIVVFWVGYKILRSCGECCKLQRKNTKFTATRMDRVACSNYHNQPSVYIFVQQKGHNLACVCWQRRAGLFLTATCICAILKGRSPRNYTS